MGSKATAKAEPCKTLVGPILRRAEDRVAGEVRMNSVPRIEPCIDGSVGPKGCIHVHGAIHWKQGQFRAYQPGIKAARYGW